MVNKPRKLAVVNMDAQAAKDKNHFYYGIKEPAHTKAFRAILSVRKMFSVVFHP